MKHMVRNPEPGTRNPAQKRRLALGLVLALLVGLAAWPAEYCLNSPLAGSWYPADPAELEAQIEGFLAQVKKPPTPGVNALILPHAGYRYSGQVAAYGIKQIAGKPYERVVVLGPTHRTAMKNIASVPEATRYGTPLGEVPLDTAFMDALKESPLFTTVPGAHLGEHSVQSEVPLLQVALDSFQLVPIVVGQLDPEIALAMAAVLRGLVDEKTLVVVSSDFTHYGPNFNYQPFKQDDTLPKNLRNLDMGAYAFIAQRDLKGLYRYVHETGITVCGRYPIAVLIAMLAEDATAAVLRYDTSGRAMGDYSNSVSYFAIAFECAWEKGEKAVAPPVPQAPPAEAAPPEKLTLAPADKESLLRIARKAIVLTSKHGKLPPFEDWGIEINPVLETQCGAFVTLEKDGRLRGCIGDILPHRPLYQSVVGNAVNAAFRDHRFRPVSDTEIGELHIEISVLTPPEAVDSYEDIVIGKHGILLSKGGRRSVYLPQVAPEQGWDRAESLSHLSQKAGLAADAWKTGASFEVFEAIVFGEAEAQHGEGI